MQQPGVIHSAGTKSTPLDIYGRPYRKIQHTVGRTEWHPNPVRSDELRSLCEKESLIALQKIILIQATIATGDHRETLADTLLKWQQYAVAINAVSSGNSMANQLPDRPEGAF